jgi:hypothetical protein
MKAVSIAALLLISASAFASTQNHIEGGSAISLMGSLVDAGAYVEGHTGKASVSATDVACTKWGNAVNEPRYTCQLTAEDNTGKNREINLKGSVAEGLFDALLGAGVPGEGAAGKVAVLANQVSCTAPLDPQSKELVYCDLEF